MMPRGAAGVLGLLHATSCLFTHAQPHVCAQLPGDKEASTSAKRKWFEDKQKEKVEQLEKLGLDPSEGHR